MGLPVKGTIYWWAKQKSKEGLLMNRLLLPTWRSMEKVQQLLLLMGKNDNADDQ